MHSALNTPYGLVTVESLSDGRDIVLSKAICGQRAVIFARLSDGGFGVVTATVDREGPLGRVLGVIRLRDHEIAGLDAAIVHARKAYEAGPR